MTREENLLTTLAEECCEVAQRCSKANRFGLMETQPGQKLNNSERIVEEFGDIYALMVLLAEDGSIPSDFLPSIETLTEKKVRVENHLWLSDQMGCLI